MAGEKNSKYKKEYDDLTYSDLMTTTEVKLIGKKRAGISCVYVFFDGDTPVYVGKTVNTKRRFEPYCSINCHNHKLNNFLSENKGEKIVRIIESEDIDSLERLLIQKYKPTLFNIAMGSNIQWSEQCKATKPWIAGTGIKSPTQIAMLSIDCKNKKDVIKKYLKSISGKSRCLLELEFAMKMPLNSGVNKWLDIVSPKMIAYLES